jgi:hypothetical protein
VARQWSVWDLGCPTTQAARAAIWCLYIKTSRREIGWSGIYWINLAEDRNQWWALVNMVMNLPVP